MRLEQYAAMVMRTPPGCFMCPTPLRAADIRHRPHADGWIVEGFKEKQWLYLECQHCSYENSLDQFGIERPEPQPRRPMTTVASAEPERGLLDDITTMAVVNQVLDDSSGPTPAAPEHHSHFEGFGGGESGGAGASDSWDSGGGDSGGGDGGGGGE